MVTILTILLVIYLLSPIPLLIAFLITRSAKKSAQKDFSSRVEEVYRLQKENADHVHSEELYRQYVKQLQDQIHELDPDAPIGVLKKPVKKEKKPLPAPQEKANAFPSMFATPASTTAASAAPETSPVLAPSLEVPAAVPESVPAVPVINEAPAQAPIAAAAPIPTQPAVAYAAPKPAKQKDDSHTLLILITGVLLLILASVGFISATWSFLTIGVRAICLLSFSAIFLGAGILAKTKLKLPNTSIAFYSIGSVAMPITLLGASAFGLFGESFGLHPPELYNTCLLAFSSLFVLLGFGALFFRSRVFATGALACVSLCVFDLALKFTLPYQLNVLMIAAYASALILLAPLVKKTPSESKFYPFAFVFEVFSIVNMYLMVIVALSMSHVTIWSGIFLLAFGAVFLVASSLKKETSLLSLPSIALILVGTAQIIKLNSLLSVCIWMLIAAACFLILSYIPRFQKIFRYVLFGFGLAFVISVTLPIAIYTFNKHDLAFAILNTVAAGMLIFLSVEKKRPIIFAGAIVPVFSLLYGTAVHIADAVTAEEAAYPLFVFRNVDMLTASLIAAIISGVLYFLFSYLPHHKFYTSTGNILLLLIFSYSVLDYAETLSSRNSTPWPFAITCAALAVLSLITACRRDRLNVRNPEQKTVPLSIRVNRCFYALIWPLFLELFTLYSFHNTPELFRPGFFIGVLLLSFGFGLFHILHSKKGEILHIGKSLGEETKDGHTLAQIFAFLMAMWTFVISMFFVLNGLVHPHNHPGFFVLQNLMVVLIPILFFAIAAKELVPIRTVSPVAASADDTPAPQVSSTSSGFAPVPFIFALLGFFSLMIVVYILCGNLPRLLEYNVMDHSHMTEHVLALLGLGFLGYLFYKRFRPATKPTSGALEDVFRKGLTEVPFAAFIFTCALSILTFLLRFSVTIDAYWPFFPVVLAVMCIGFIILFWDHYTAVPAIAAVFFTMNFLELIEKEVPVMLDLDISKWGTVLLFLIPILLLCLILYFRRNRNLSADGLFYGTLISQFAIFARAFNNRRYWSVLVLTLIGFLLIELVALLRAGKDKDGDASAVSVRDARLRALSLMAVTVSAVVWFSFQNYDALAMQITQLYLLPPTVFAVLIGYIFPRLRHAHAATEKGKPSTLYRIHFVYSCVLMGLLAVIALENNTLFDLIFFGILSFLILVVAYFRQKKAYIILGCVCILGMLAYIANRVWGNMAWWIYLFVTGAILVTIAVRNEIKKRS